MKRMLRAFINPFSIVLLLLAAISFFTDVVFASNFSRDITKVIIILAMLLLSGIVRAAQEVRSKRITERLLRLVDTTVQVYRDGAWQEIPSAELSIGDQVRLDAGDRVPADIRLTKTADFFVSQSAITGESDILEKEAAPAGEEAKAAHTVFFGSTIIGGRGEGVVCALGEDSVYGIPQTEEAVRKNGFDKGENSIAWVLIRFMLLLVPVVFIACGLTKNNWLEAFLFALSVAVGLTPELLPMVMTACLGKGTYQMGQKKTVVKNTNAMQGFGSMDILCVDKTGTLTKDKVLLEYYTDVLGNESADTLNAAFLNSHFQTGVANHLDKALLQASHMPGQEARFEALLQKCKKLDELPFDYERKMASVLVDTGETRALLVKGSVHQVVSCCSYVWFGGKRCPMEGDATQSVEQVVGEMRSSGMKVLAVAARVLEEEKLTPKEEEDLTLLGYLAFFDGPKQSANSAIGRLRQLNIKVKLLTGDHADVAVSVCRRLGIPTDFVLTGAQLDALAENDIPMAVERTHIFAELSPKQKSAIVEQLEENGHSVGFLGDGINDLPAMLQADVGISVDTAVDAVKESADVILLKKDLNVLGEGVLEGRKAFANMLKYIKITASSNFGNIFAIVFASVLLPFFPMTSLQLLLLNLLYDMLCLILPWDNVDEEFFKKPLEWSGRTLRRFMLCFGPVSTALDLLTFAFLYFFLCPALCGGSYAQLTLAGQAQFVALFQTGWFLESMWTQVLILHLLRTKKLAFFQSRPSRPVLLVTVLGILLFTLLTVTPFGAWLGLTAMPLLYYVFLVGIVLLYLLLVTAMKMRYIKKYRSLI